MKIGFFECVFDVIAMASFVRGLMMMNMPYFEGHRQTFIYLFPGKAVSL